MLILQKKNGPENHLFLFTRLLCRIINYDILPIISLMPFSVLENYFYAGGKSMLKVTWFFWAFGNCSVIVWTYLTHFILYSSVGLVYLMYRAFESVCIQKPNTSRPANSERYLVCKGKRKGADSIAQFMLEINARLNQVRKLFWAWNFICWLIVHNTQDNYMFFSVHSMNFINT